RRRAGRRGRGPLGRVALRDGGHRPAPRRDRQAARPPRRAGAGDPAPPFRPRPGRAPHPRGGRGALQPDPRADPPDRGPSHVEAAPPEQRHGRPRPPRRLNRLFTTAVARIAAWRSRRLFGGRVLSPVRAKSSHPWVLVSAWAVEATTARARALDA